MIYPFECESCKKLFDLNRNIADRDSPTTCPDCGSDSCTRLMVRPVVKFVGNGWSTNRPGQGVPTGRREAAAALNSKP